jgi:hypothetical protein
MRLEDFDNDEDKIIKIDWSRKHGMRYVQTTVRYLNHEFVNGYEQQGQAVCVYFGSARTKPEDKYTSLQAYYKISKAGWITRWSWYYGGR